MIGLCLLLCFTNAYAFRGIRFLLSSQAVVVSLLDEVTHELLDRPLALREFTGIMNHHVDYFYIGCFASSVSYFAFYRLHSYPYRLNELSIYKGTYSNFRAFLFIILMVFIRDVENAI
jgi:hypothetical protein